MDLAQFVNMSFSFPNYKMNTFLINNLEIMEIHKENEFSTFLTKRKAMKLKQKEENLYPSFIQSNHH